MIKNLLVDYEKILDHDTGLITSEAIGKYHADLKEYVRHAMRQATMAREKGFDPKKEVEIYIAQDVASRTEGLVGPAGIAKRLKELEKEYKKDKIAVLIAKEIAAGKHGEMDNIEDLAEQALRTALSYQTEGITAAPIEGISKVAIKPNADGSNYLAVYYAGPIRSAGGTAQGVSVYIADEIRKTLGLAPYQATDTEVERILEEVRLYNKIMHLQLPTSDEEIRHAWRNISVMITGDPTEKEEVSGYRNIVSMDSNRVRGGACLVINDGLVGRALKIMKRVDKLKLDGWEWLREIAKGTYSDRKGKEEEHDASSPTEVIDEVKPDFSFVADALMGRPTFAGPTAIGGFRLRYGHSRNTGIAGVGVHPATMAIVSDFLAPGTHIRTERPGKGSIVAPVDSIAPPVVLLSSGQVLKVTSYKHGVQIRDSIKEILFLGDILIGVGEFAQNNYTLCPAGYCEEWWLQEMQAAGWNTDAKIQEAYYNKPSLTEALKLATEYSVALHPDYTPAFRYAQLAELAMLQQSIWENEFLPMTCKHVLEDMLVPHFVSDEQIVVGDYLQVLQACLPKEKPLNITSHTSYHAVQEVSTIEIRDFIGTTIGARMGRPEKAKGRRISPALHGLFPIGKNVNRQLHKAANKRMITVELADRQCKSCDLHTFMVYCPQCSEETELMGRCKNPRCRNRTEEPPCDLCGSNITYLIDQEVNIEGLIKAAYMHLGLIGDIDVKLLSNLKNPHGTAEYLEKAIIRAKYDLHVFRDGTIRYDATDAPMTHFKPGEVGISVNRLVELGYTYDMDGAPLTMEDQILEIKPQDIIVNSSCIDYLTRVANFIDDELENIYGMDRFYNIQTADDLAGQLIIGLAPHTSAGVIGRIIGFTRASVCWAHPWWHSAKRRNCDGDEDGIMLLMDGLLNFSKEYLPTTRGSKMDTPLVLVVTLNPLEVDDESFNLDCMLQYPLEFYQAASIRKKPKDIIKLIQRAENRLKTEGQFEGFVFSHPASRLDDGPKVTRYKDSELDIRAKLEFQLYLADIIRAVDAPATALRILEKHALPDLMGNLRAFASQTVRCSKCNTKYRRVPLTGACRRDGCIDGKLMLTVYPNSVGKYFDVCEELVTRYHLGKYHEDRLERLKIALDSHFASKKDKQLDLSVWFGQK